MHHHNALCTEISCIFCTSKNPMEESLRLQRCLSAARIWCTMMSPDPWKTSQKRNIPVAGMWRTYAHSQPFSAPWGYQAAVIDRSLDNKTEKHPSICQWRVSFKRLTGSKGVRHDVHDKRQLQTIGGSVRMKVPKCGWVKADESESSWPGPNVKQLSNLVSYSRHFFLLCLMVKAGTICA